MNLELLTPYLFGLATSAGLIIAIGAQNAFVLRQGLRREHVLPVVVVCAVSDAVLIALGTAGIGWLSHGLPWAVPLLTVAGIVFLTTYGVQAARRAWRQDAGLSTTAGGDGLSRRAAVWRALAFSWLNPHVWLDTVVLVGSLAHAQGEGRQWVFAAGGVTASVLWFSGLAWAAGRLAPLFQRPQAWRVLDAGIAVMMLALAGGLASQLQRA